MKVISKNELFEMIPDKGKSLLMWLGVNTSPAIYDEFIAKGKDHTCQRWVYVQLKFEGETMHYCCLKLQYQQSSDARVLEARETFNDVQGEIEIVLDLVPMEAIIFDSQEEGQLHLHTHSAKSKFQKPIHN